ncbi:SRPBCC family protein [Actinomadura sp. ATCC 31491]|uniref:SRPBCC family protein n=1 Tax=Actinomadura luzonensis TaxID=2805427 RepID=A0ABT0G642_9ACTN|nr:SRPBCC family protein [Actinomadura luzonensis]MCK2220091.1 SRPBCC family protein [Actinomadura luzonensis]
MLFLPRLLPRSMFRFAAGAAAGYLLAVRPWHLRWGADDAEVHGEMAGDDLVTVPQYQATRAVTVEAPPAAVWPWVVRFGGYVPGAYTGPAPGEGGEQPDLKAGEALPGVQDAVVERAEPPHTLVLAQRGAEAVASCSIALRELPDNRTRMVFRVRIRAEPGLGGVGYLARMDLSDFVAMRRRMLTVKERAEATA